MTATQVRTIGSTKYTFVCMEGRNGYDVIEVCVPGVNASSQMYPKYRYERYKAYPWQLLGKSDAESSKLLDVLSEIWDGAIL